MKKLSTTFLLFVLLSFTPVDEAMPSRVSNGYNPLSLRQVHESYLMWKRTLWRRVDLMEKQNKPFFAINRELSKVIIEAVQNGVLIPYSSDSVNDSNIMAREDFLTNIQQETFEEDDPFGGGFEEDDPFAAFEEDDPFAEEEVVEKRDQYLYQTENFQFLKLKRICILTGSILEFILIFNQFLCIYQGIVFTTILV